MDVKSIYQHFHPDEKEFVDRIFDKVQQVIDQYRIELTSFLNPREAFITNSIARRAGLQVFSSGDVIDSESVRLILAPDYYVLDQDDFEMVLLELTYARKFNTLTHSQTLGNLVNQLGIKRQLLGDIILNDTQTQVLVDQKISDYLVQYISKISRVPVTWKQVPFDQIVQTSETQETQQVLATSLRLDALIATAYGLSRQLASKLVEQNKVKVNHQPATSSALTLKVGDLVSCRGFGRFTLVSEQGQTRHGKLKLTLAKIGGK